MQQLLVFFGAFLFLAFSGVFHSDKRVFNFSAGPASLPLPVLERARAELLGSSTGGAAVFEQSHRDAGGAVQVMMSRAVDRLRRLLSVPPSHEVLFMQGGAHGQFAALPLNLCSPGQTGDFVRTGFWSNRARDEAARHAAVATNLIEGVTADGKSLRPASQWNISSNSCFVHFCASETIDSLEYFEEPVLSRPEVPLVGDFTSTLLSRPVDVAKYGVIYASGGKNLGPAGFVLVIVRRDLLSRVSSACPSVLSWKAHAETKPIPSLFNTPPVLALWLHELTTAYYESLGGMPVLAASVNRRKELVYGEIDGSDFYVMPVNKAHRSAMSISFTIAVKGVRRPDLEKKFVDESASQGLIQLFGHPVRGGLRITLYHGVPDAAVDALLIFMRKFRHENNF